MLLVDHLDCLLNAAYVKRSHGAACYYLNTVLQCNIDMESVMNTTFIIVLNTACYIKFCSSEVELH